MDVYAATSIDRGLVSGKLIFIVFPWKQLNDKIALQYVQGGGCTSVGVVGWSIGGGYGSLSKKFGTGPANLLEARDVFVKITQNIYVLYILS